MPADRESHNSPPHHRRLSSDAALWASAFLLLGLILAQGGRLANALVSPAKGDVVSRVGEYTAISVNESGSNDVVMVLDGRGEQLFIYQVKNRTQFELLNKYSLQEMFAQGLRIGSGRVK